jgi:hypothetical protein
MAKTRDIVTHVSVEVAERKRICHHKPKEHSISGGESCLVIKDSATLGRKNYCTLCAPAILAKAKARIAEFEHQLP